MGWGGIDQTIASGGSPPPTSGARVKYRSPRAAPRQYARRSWPIELFIVVLIALVVWLGPRGFEGYTALQWTRYHAAASGDAKLPEHARQTGRWAGRTVERLAPLPPAIEATRLALDLARDLAPEHREEAQAVCDEILPPLARVRATRWRGLGLDARGAELEALSSDLRARATAAPAKTGP
jgi:hypothetical protein